MKSKKLLQKNRTISKHFGAAHGLYGRENKIEMEKEEKLCDGEDEKEHSNNFVNTQMKNIKGQIFFDSSDKNARIFERRIRL
jgi:hypothetical protein